MVTKNKDLVIEITVKPIPQWKICAIMTAYAFGFKRLSDQLIRGLIELEVK
jgi:hypothetical protein